MKKRTVWKAASTFILALLIFYPAHDVHSSGFAIYTQGAGSLGQGNSVTAHLESPSAIFINPALINKLEGTKLEIGTTIIWPSRKFESDATGDSYKAESNVFFPSTFYITHKYNEKLSFGLGIFNPFGLGNEWGEDWEGKYLTTNNEMRTFNINPVISYQVTPNLTLAAGLDYLLLDATREVMIDLPTLGALLPCAPCPAPSDGKQKFEGDGDGIGFNLGLLFDINDDISFGASYRSEIEVDVNGDASFSIPAGTDPAIVSYFPDTTGKTTITLPQQVHAGIAYKGVDKLTLEAGIRWEGWSSYDELKFELDKAPLGQPSAIAKDWDDTFSFLVGGEYMLNDMVAIRAGYLFANNPIPDDTFEPSIPDSDTHIFTLGTGIKYKQCKIDLAYAFQHLEDRNKDNTVSNLPSPLGTPVNGEYDSSMHMFAVSISHTF